MKLRNKKTGEIIELLAKPSFVKRNDDYLQSEVNTFNSLAELNEEWEDYEEPKTHWYIYGAEPLEVDDGNWDEEFINELKDTGNYFEAEEEAENAVEKLKAWKRLKDGGITFKNWTINQTGTIDCFATWGDNIPPSRKNPTLLEDLNLLFGGEE